MSSHLETYVRIVLSLGAFLSILFAPWWVPVLCMVLLSLRFSAWEVPLIGLFMDLLWMPGETVFSVPLFTLIGIVLVWGAHPLRKQFLL